MFSKTQKAESNLNQNAEKRQSKTKIPSIISADLCITGNLKSDSDIQIDGIVDGNIESKILTVGENATVNGDINGEVIRVAGTVNGGITGKIIELTKSARVTGDINHHSLEIEAGAFVHGFCCRVGSGQSDLHVAGEDPQPTLMAAKTKPEKKQKDNSDDKSVEPKSAAI